jgi:hypothetical protein
MFFSDLHVQLLAKGILNPGEQLVGQTVTAYHPWWAFGFIRRQYLVLATDQRLILVDHRYSFWLPLEMRLHQVDSMAWSSVQELKMKGIFNKKLRVKGIGERGPISLTMPIPNYLFGLLAPMRNNMAGARSVAAAFQGAAGAPQLNALHAGQQHGYAQPQLSYAPQAPQLAAPQQQAYGAPPSSLAPQSVPNQMAVPPQNSPGYASVPPPPVAGPYGVPQQPQQQQAAPASIPPAFGAPPRQWS